MAKLMQAAQLVALGQPLQVREVPRPAVAEEDVLVRPVRCGLNGGDPHLVSGDFRVSPEYLPHLKLPITIGHDPVGVVAEVGPSVEGFRAGDRVFINPNMECGRCVYCRTDGAHICTSKMLRGWVPLTAQPVAQFARYKDGLCAEYAVAHYSSLFKLPDDVSFKSACHLNEIGVAYRALLRARITHGDVVVVTGATGCTGMSVVLLARLFNPRKIIAVARDRRKLAHLQAIDPDLIETVSVLEDNLSQRLTELTDGIGADVLVDFVPRGAEVTVQSMYRLRPGGRVILAGGCTEELSISYRFLMRSSLEISSSRGPCPQDFPLLIDFIRTGQFRSSTIEVREFGLGETNDALRVFSERTGDRPFWVHILPNADLS
jgi:alcohol dehydrogenase